MSGLNLNQSLSFPHSLLTTLPSDWHFTGLCLKVISSFPVPSHNLEQSMEKQTQIQNLQNLQKTNEQIICARFAIFSGSCLSLEGGKLGFNFQYYFL